MSNSDHRPKIIAIDPGLNGAWAVLSSRGEFISVGELPRFDKLINGIEFSNIVKSFSPELAVIERVGARPGQGVTSMFTFGAAYGMVLGVVSGAQIPYHLVTPQRWKSYFRLLGKSKDASREAAIQHFPAAAKHLNLKKHAGRADALLLGLYFLTLKIQGKTP